MSRIRNLSSAIVESIKRKEMVDELPEMLLTRDRTKVLHRNETEYWDYKDIPNLADPANIAKFAKRVLSFHNAKGGVLIHGVDANSFAARGLTTGDIVDSNELNQRLRKYIGSTFSIFQESIDVTNGRLLWLVFIPRRLAGPVSMQANGPADANGKLQFKQHEYYLRVEDETKVCSEPLDLERLFAGNASAHFQAYLFEVDEPYFRLLAPHCDVFVGRRALIDEIKQLMDSRHPVISLDGVGGVGKSAIAIEMVKELYKEQKYMFIVSMSAKSKVWIGHVGTRVAGFSGMTEFLREIARVLQVHADDEVDKLKVAVIGAMKDIEGLILVDNIEDVTDPEILNFLSLEVPAPVKVLVTSRIDRGLGAIFKSVPEMNDDEAAQLLSQELGRVSYNITTAETPELSEILAATGRLPLAIKWAASLAPGTGSLREVSKRLRSMDSSKKEFLNFCFKTMFDELSVTAQNVATLSPYLAHEWNVPTLAISLDLHDGEIEQAVGELKERGIVLASSGHRNEPMRLLPLTLDFLSNRWHENQRLSSEVLQRIADAIGAGGDDQLLTNWEPAKRIEFILRRVAGLRETGNYETAKKLIRVANSWTGKARNCKLAFAEGQLTYLSGEKMSGLACMKESFDFADPEESYAEEKRFLATALLKDGAKKDEILVTDLLSDAIVGLDDIDPKLVSQFVKIAVEAEQFENLRSAASETKSTSYAHVMSKVLQECIHKDPTLPFRIGTPLINLLRLAARHSESTAIERQRLQRLIAEYEAKFKSK